MTTLIQSKYRFGRHERQGGSLGRSAATDLGYVKLKPGKISIPRKLAKGFDQDVACALAESIEADDLINAPLVRKVQDRWVCVAGQHRIQACILSGKDEIVCKVFRGDEVEAERIQLAEDLYRKHLTVLEKAKKQTRYLDLLAAKFDISGQVVQKSGPGRREGRLSRAARQMPVHGRTAEARRKEFSRDTKIASITPEAQAAAIEAGLDDNQAALLKIKEAGSSTLAQLAAVRRITAQQPSANPNGKKSAKRRTDANDDAATSEVMQQKAGSEAPQETQLSELEALWNAHLKVPWKWASKDSRTRLIGMISRARLYAKPDIEEFIHRVFSGRSEVELRVAKELASRSGVDWQQLKGWLKHFGFKNRRRQHIGTRFFQVPDDYRGRIRIMTDAELNAVADEVHERRTRNATRPETEKANGTPDNYYDR